MPKKYQLFGRYSLALSIEQYVSFSYDNEMVTYWYDVSDQFLRYYDDVTYRISRHKKKLPTWAIIVIVLSSLLFALLVTLIIRWKFFKKKPASTKIFAQENELEDDH